MQHGRVLVPIVLFSFFASVSTAAALPADECSENAWGLHPLVQLVRRHLQTQNAEKLQLTDDAKSELRKAFFDTHVLNNLYARAESIRFDKQQGAGAVGPGTTSLLSKAVVPRLIGLAVEHGALTRSEDGTTVTLQANPLDLVKARMKIPYLRAVGCDPRSIQWLGGFSLSASFVADNAADPTFDESTLSTFKVRYQWGNNRDPRIGKRAAALAAAAADVSRISTDVTTQLDAALARSEDIQNAMMAFQEKIRTSAPALRTNVGPSDELLNRLVDRIIADMPKMEAMSLVAPGALARRLEAQEPAIDKALRGQVLSVELTYDRTTVGETLPIWKALGVYQFGGSVVDFTINGGVSWLATIPSNPGGEEIERLKDGELAFQTDVRLGTPTANIGTISGGYRLLGLKESLRGLRNVPEGQSRFRIFKDGAIHVVQVKWNVPMSGGTIMTPFSFTWSNREEYCVSAVGDQQCRAQWGGSMGLTFDLDKVIALRAR